ncbi:MAG: DinB family protein [Acidimicrobiales bacterium]
MGWVCGECGLDYDKIAPTDIPVALRSYPRRYREALALHDDDDHDEDEDEDEAILRARPEPEVWSALEYAAHVDDVFADFIDMFRGWLGSGTPGGGNWDPDERAAEQRYNEHDPDAVLADLAEHASALAGVLDRAEPEDWTRTGKFPFGERDLLTMARNAVHEGAHHLRDIRKVLGQVRSAGSA